MVGETAPEATAIPLARRDQPERDTLVRGLAMAHTHGIPVRLTELVPVAPHVDLPTYAFQHGRYWLDQPLAPGADPVARVDAPEPVDTEPESLVTRLVGRPAVERESILLDFVLAKVASTLGHDDAVRVDPGQHFQDIGFSSITALELRNHLRAATGVALPASVIYDLTTPRELSTYLSGELGGSPAPNR
jgi:acyl transferase domain-containing protein